ncbi:efflux RND transporter periplasmic adaptor subunit [Paenibacillus spongiae]|uniref:Efflux RND transporter periplasmic adaptor subunit n=1 Tax=Paenibacillus spongiae TaxID=2909671 RepID=A0ABY5SFT9_9BACL|nr:efflux RND transporter periplasmic adaptor subunit [Paenibacillus spongiae]UVI32857.1 efflux RND transporter periplasmic adaptor subunit [Paenibacillus spongiae]
MEIGNVLRDRRKRNIRIAASLFFGLMLLVTFFSNTLQQLTYPKVQTVKPVFQQLNHVIKGEGTLTPRAIEKVYDNSGWKVALIEAEVGDEVKKGQRLLTLDTTEARNELLDAEVQYKKNQLQLETMQSAYQTAYKAAVHDQSSDANLLQARVNMEHLKLDMQIQERKLRIMREALSKQQFVVAPKGGIVTEVNADLGIPTDPRQPVVQIADLSQGFGWTLAVANEQVRGLKVGEEVELYLNGNRQHLIRATVADIKDAEATETTAAGKQLSFHVTATKLKGGEAVGIHWERKSGLAMATVPKEIVDSDAQGHFVYIVEERRGPLDNQFTIRKRYVTLGEADEQNQAILDGLMEDDKVMTESNEPVNEGDLVRM